LERSGPAHGDETGDREDGGEGEGSGEALDARGFAGFDIFFTEQFEEIEVRLEERGALSGLDAGGDFAEEPFEERGEDEDGDDVEEPAEEHPECVAVHGVRESWRRSAWE
jgi:hypothetical protein